MQISKKSWHYKFITAVSILHGLHPLEAIYHSEWNKATESYKHSYKYHHAHIPKSLCPYFWTLMAHLVANAFAVTFMAGVSAGLIFVVYLLLTKYLVNTLETVGTVVGGFVLGFVLWKLWKLLAKQTYNVRVALAILMQNSVIKRLPKQNESKGPSILWEYIKSIKGSVCPMLEFVDEKVNTK